MRINKTITDEIVSEVLKAGKYTKQIDVIMKEWQAAARESALAYIEEQEPGFHDVVKNLPATWFPQLASLHPYFSFGSDGLQPATVNRFNHVSFDPVLYPAQIPMGFSDALRSITPPFTKRVNKIVVKQEKAEAATRRLIAQYRTTEALLKDAPEFRKFIKDASPSGMLPAVIVSNIMAELMESGVELAEAA